MSCIYGVSQMMTITTTTTTQQLLGSPQQQTRVNQVMCESTQLFANEATQLRPAPTIVSMETSRVWQRRRTAALVQLQMMTVVCVMSHFVICDLVLRPFVVSPHHAYDLQATD